MRRTDTARAAALCAAALCAAGAAQTQTGSLDPVVVTGSRVETRVLDAPYAIGVVGADELRAGGAMVNLSEALVRVPGLTIGNRSNYAQDLQISSRGFGARASFGVRGLRLYTDGIPATMPDGSGQVTHFDLAGAERIEVLRGPFSALYGNSSGGVIALFSAEPKSPRVELGFDSGAFGLRQVRAGVGGPVGDGWHAQAQLSHFEIDGFRPRSAAQRDLMTARLGYAGANDRVTLLVNSLDQPADDPLGLTRAQFDADPLQTTPQATQFRTRKQAEQSQLGVNWQHRFGESSVLAASELVVYAGDRSVTQWQSILPATQLASPRHPGGVIDFDRSYQGVDGRLQWRLGSVRLVTGLNHERQDEDRRGFENFTGAGASQVLGVTGALRRDERNRARSTDVYAQGDAELGAFTATLGVRSGKVEFDARDAFLANGDDSGARSFSYTSPVAALAWRAAPTVRVYASVGRGFEAPTLNELAYRPDGTSGFNDSLRAQRSRQFELGAKWRTADGRAAVDVALFEARTSDEIAVLTNSGGRSSFQNVGRTTRRGAELAARWQFAPALRAAAALTWLDARYRDDFLACAGVPCTAPSVPVPAGNRIAGTQPRGGFAELAWAPSDATELAAEWRGQGRTAVNDTNSDFAAGFGVLSLRARQRYTLGGGAYVEAFARIDNLADKRYAGTVIVNEGNARFFETAPPRAWLLGVRVGQGF